MNTFEQEVTKVSNTKGLDSDWAQKYFCAQSQAWILIGFGTGRLRIPGARSFVFANLAAFRLPHDPTICPWVCGDDYDVMLHELEVAI